MKARFTLLAFLLLCLTGLNAQTGFFGGSGVPLKPQSPLFGKDIVIYNVPTEDQGNVAICSAFNGWLFVAFSYDSLDLNAQKVQRILILKSIDNGINWSRFFDLPDGLVNEYYPKVDIVSCGNTIDDLKVFVGVVWHDTIFDDGSANVIRFNGSTGVPEGNLLYDPIHRINNLALASDITSSNPGTLGILVSITYNNTDSLIFLSSSDGGLSIDNHKNIAHTQNAFKRMSLAFGYSPSTGNGRYFATWEEQNSQFAILGHIYTAHSEPDVNSPFTTPVQLDAIDPSATNICRNPSIACQVNNTDNDSANLTEVVLFEKYKPSGGDYDVTGYYNLQATTTSHFRPLNIAVSSNNELQPDISFNPYNSKFMVTYFDSTAKKLPFLINDVNLVNPNSWNVINQGYNDNSNLVAPYPKVKVNFGQQEGMNAWISEGTGGNGIALFDAPYSTYTGVSESSTGTWAKLIGSYPNPCSTTINISFELNKAGKVTIDVTSIMGQPLGTVTDQNYPAGKQVIHYDVSNLAVGNYLYKFRSGDFTAIGKITVIR